MDPLKILISILFPVWDIIKAWWWLPAPFILWKAFLFLWLWWRQEIFNSKIKRILLEIRIPKEVLKPIRAMESVLSTMWQVLFDAPGGFWENWIEGKFIVSYSFEIAAINGEPHFFVRIPESARDPVEAAIYSQYPEAEITLADDYTKYVPPDIPNRNWDLWGADYRLFRREEGGDAYPIKTYMKFETEREALEEKRIDPMASLLEAMAKTGPGEQIWVQIIARPISDKEVHWVTKGHKLKDKIARRQEVKLSDKPLLWEAFDLLATGTMPGGKVEEKKEEMIPPEMKLTPGEREIITAVEEKISKLGFQTSLRFIYLGEKEKFFKPRLRLALSYFGSFSTQNLNSIVPHGQPLITKVQKSWFLPLNGRIYDRRLYLRKRNIFRKYKWRETPLFPREGGTFVLNTEELATLFHLPGRISAPAPSFQRIEAKKGEAPSGLPTE
jgi:hypothetical protein